MKLSFSKTAALAAVALAAAVSLSPARAAGTIDAAGTVCVISKAQAEATALAAVGGGTILQAVCERDHSIHWSIDIRGATHEHEVWVSTQNKVIKIITQPL